MARKLQQKLQKVSVYIRIRLTDSSQPYCPAIWESKKRLRPHWCLVRGKPEHHPEGVCPFLSRHSPHSPRSGVRVFEGPTGSRVPKWRTSEAGRQILLENDSMSRTQSKEAVKGRQL
jgi:hypothetical protein